MNKLIDIRNKHNISNKELALIFGVHPNTINNMLDKELINLPLSHIMLLRDTLDIPYNTLLGETIFTVNNIDSKDNIQVVSILDNPNEYNRLFDKLKEELKEELSNNKE